MLPSVSMRALLGLVGWGTSSITRAGRAPLLPVRHNSTVANDPASPRRTRFSSLNACIALRWADGVSIREVSHGRSFAGHPRSVHLIEKGLLV